MCGANVASVVERETGIVSYKVVFIGIPKLAAHHSFD